MMYTNIYCMFLLVRAVAGLLSASDAVPPVKYVCPGDSVQVFQNIEFNSCNANVSLNINGGRYTQIAVWSIQNCIRNESIIPGYQGRLIFDQIGTITIQNFGPFDQAKYIVISKKMVSLPKIYEVQLSLMVAPTKACKPMIEKYENSLIARLNANDCGKPVALPYWKDTSGVSSTNDPMLKLIPGAEDKEYYACIKGAALTCVKNATSHDYCTTFKTEGSKNPPSRLDTCSPDALIAVCIILGIFVILVVLVLSVKYIRSRPRKKNVKDEQTVMLLDAPSPWTHELGKLDWEDIRKLLNDDQQRGLQTYCDNLSSQNHTLRQEQEIQSENVNDEEPTMPLETNKPWTNEFGKLHWEEIRQLLNDDQQMGLQVYCEKVSLQTHDLRRERERQCENVNDEELETPMSWTNEFGKLNWEDIRKLLNDDQQMGLQTYCENVSSHKHNLRREQEGQGDVELDKEDAWTEQHSCTDQDKIIELTELRDADHCKICLSNKMSEVFLPCKHIATCSKCSSSLAHCPVCRAVIEDKLTISFD